MKPFLLLALVLVLVAALGWMSCVRHDRLALVGEELLYDDFGFSVKGVERSKTFAGATAKGEFWLVDLQVSNHAKRVGYEMKSHQAVIVDAEGRRFEPLPADAVEELAHGESCVSRLAFDLPEDARVPRLKIRFGKIGSALDFVLLGDWSLALR